MTIQNMLVSQWSSGSGVLTYEQARPLIQTGDILLAKGADNNIIAAGIRLVTGSEYTHAAIARVDYGRVLAYEATSQGTTDNPLSQWAGRRYKQISVYRSDAVNVADVMEFLLDYKGIKYGFDKIGKIWWHSLFPRTPMADRPDLDSIICSQYVSGAYLNGGVDICDAKPDAYTSPGDISLSPKLNHEMDFTI